MNTFESANIDYKMIDNVCYVNAEEVVSHLKTAVSEGIAEINKEIDSGHIDKQAYVMAFAGLQGMVGVGMWIEEGLIESTAEDFRKILDEPWPDVQE
jgi:hypothetical protein